MNVVEVLSEKLGAEVREVSVTKNNGIELTGVSVKMPNSNLAAVIYKGEDDQPEEFVNKVLSKMDVIKEAPMSNKPFELSKEYILNNVYPALVNTSLNKEMLEKRWVNKKFKDLSIIYKIDVDMGTTTVVREIMDAFDISITELTKAAMNNLDPTIIDMADFAAKYSQSEGTPRGMMYIVSNENHVYGAGSITSKGICQTLYELLGEFFIIPASVHEVLCVGKPEHISVEDQITALKAMVYDTNRSEVDPSEFLSDSLYHFDGKNITVVE